MPDKISALDKALVAWSFNFDKKLLTYADLLSVSAADVSAAATHTQALRKLICLTKDNKNNKDNGPEKAIHVSHLQTLIHQLKKNYLYSAAIGEDIGVNHEAIKSETYSDRPVLTVVAAEHYRILDFLCADDIDGVNIYTRLKGETSWKKLSYDSHSPYIDNRSHSHGTGSVEYMCIGVKHNREVGNRSHIVSEPTTMMPEHQHG